MVGSYPLQNVTKGLTTERQCLISWSVEGFHVLLFFSLLIFLFCSMSSRGFAFHRSQPLCQQLVITLCHSGCILPENLNVSVFGITIWCFEAGNKEQWVDLTVKLRTQAHQLSTWNWSNRSMSLCSIIFLSPILTIIYIINFMFDWLTWNLQLSFQFHKKIN